MTPEGKVKQQVREILAEFGAYYVMPMGQQFGRSGVPDFIVCLKGFFFSIETKAKRNRPTMLQERNMNEILKAGGSTIVVDETGIDLFRQHIAKFYKTMPYATNAPLRSVYTKGNVEVSHNPYPERRRAIKTEGGYSAENSGEHGAVSG